MQFSIVERGRLQVCDGVRQSLATAAQITVLVRGMRLPARPLAPARTLLGSGPSLPLPESRPYLRLQPKGGRMRSAGWIVLGVLVGACGSAPSGGGTIQPPPIEAADAGPPAADGGGDYGSGSGNDGGGIALDVDPWKELVIVDSSVVLDARTSNASDGAWSFRQLMERLGPGDLAETWLRTYRQTALNGFAVDDRKGVEDLIASWPRR